MKQKKAMYVISPTTDCFQAAVTAKCWGHFRHKGKANKQRHTNERPTNRDIRTLYTL